MAARGVAGVPDRVRVGWRLVRGVGGVPVSGQWHDPVSARSVRREGDVPRIPQDVRFQMVLVGVCALVWVLGLVVVVGLVLGVIFGWWS